MPAAGEARRFAVFVALDYASGEIVWRLSPHKDRRVFVAIRSVGGHAAGWPRGHRVGQCELPEGSASEELVDGTPRLGASVVAAAHAPKEAATVTLPPRLPARFHQSDRGGIALVQNSCEAANGVSANQIVWSLDLSRD
jgi:hypothetical protein